MKLEFSRWSFEKYLNVKFRENPSSGSRVIPCSSSEGQTDRQREMTKLIAAFCSFVDVPEKGYDSTRTRNLRIINPPH